MTFKKPALLTLLMVAAMSVARAQNSPLVAQLSYNRDNDKPTFSAHWFAGAKKGIVSLGLQWFNFSTDFADGFRLEGAETSQVLSPELPADCKLSSIRGTIYGNVDRGTVIGIDVNGAGCESFIEATHHVPLRLLFKNVPRVEQGYPVDALELDVIEAPGTF